jgi:hypothetical protein
MEYSGGVGSEESGVRSERRTPDSRLPTPNSQLPTPLPFSSPASPQRCSARCRPRRRGDDLASPAWERPSSATVEEPAAARRPCPQSTTPAT